MLRSPDGGGGACYLRLTPEEWQLAQLMDGTRTVARLVAEFARIAGRLAPDQVTRVVADLAGNRMLDELPVDAFRPLRQRPPPAVAGPARQAALLAFAQGRRIVLADIDPRHRLPLPRRRPAAVHPGRRGARSRSSRWPGSALFVWTWWRGTPVGLPHRRLVRRSARSSCSASTSSRWPATSSATRWRPSTPADEVPAAGFLVYFGIPSVFVDTTDVWMAGRRARIITTAAGPAAGLVLAGIASSSACWCPRLAPWTFKLAFAWYLNALFNLNPFLALDGYYLLMDWLEIPNLRARGLAWVVGRLRRRPPRWGELDREGRLVALYGMLAVLWLVIAVNLGYRIWADRVAGLVTGLWHSGWPARLLLVAVVCGLAAPLVYFAVGLARRRWRALRRRLAEQRRADQDAPRRLAALRASALGGLPAAALAELADAAPAGCARAPASSSSSPAPPSRRVYVVVDGALEGRRPGDPSGHVRERRRRRRRRRVSPAR